MVLWTTVGSLSVSCNRELLKRLMTIETKWLQCKPSLLQTLTLGWPLVLSLTLPEVEVQTQVGAEAEAKTEAEVLSDLSARS